MMDTPQTAPRAQSVTMAAKVTGEGPMVLTTAEANELRETIRAVLERDNELLLRLVQLEATNRVNVAMAQALQRQGFVMKSQLNPDGTVSWNLQNKPQQTAETVN